MTKTKKFFFSNIWIIVSCLSLFLAYSLLQPRISNWIPFIREYRLSSFISHTIKNKNISAQEFWQMREFYSPGVIQFKRPNLTFTSSKISSRETLVDKNTTLQSLLPNSIDEKIIYKNENELITTKGNKTHIYFVKPISEMATANGFFDCKDKDKKLLEDKNWYVSTTITQ